MINKTKKNNKNIANKTKRAFKKKDFLSGDGMVTKIWGPIFWTAIHTVSFNYPVNPTNNDKKNYMNFIYNLRYILPCKYCRINLINNLKTKPLLMCHMKNRDTFSRYVYELHELVNKMLKKKSHLTYCDVRERYENFRSRCTLNETKNKIFNFRKIKNKTKKEKGCTEPLYGKKSKCIINIVPEENKKESFQINKECIKKKI